MSELLATPATRIVLSVAILIILILLSWYGLTNFRGRIDEDIPQANDHLDNFREIRSKGDISDVEFRNIKTVLGEQLHQESPDLDDSKEDADSVN
ncbi:MAG: hypothetical protein ACON5G_16805 [Pirellulaceae bacterium]|nr:hypothetical protein [Rhodopirellula sp.]MCH2600165.1 hypothetical protein [Pirellulales bacterium]